MLQELTIEYNMANWREAMNSLKATDKYQNDTYLFDISSTSEAWLFKNPEALAMVQRGLKDAAEGRVKKVDLKKL